MKLETFFEKFDLFANAPNAVVKMRELVLQLAILGKLSEQHEKDGSGTELLAAIVREKQRCRTKFNLPSTYSVAGEHAHTFRIPDNWAWCTLSAVALQIQYGYTASADHTKNDVRMLRITDIQDNRVEWSSVPGCEITPTDAEKYLLRKNDILIARTGGTIGKSFIMPDVPVKAVFASYLIRVTPPRSIEARYLKIFLQSPIYWEQLTTMSAGTGQPNVNGQALGRLQFPMPPLAEQMRIVARVDELMTLCDRLEAQQKEREERHVALSRAAIARFEEAPTPANLDLLFHQSFSIAPGNLCKVILNQAVQGKLVPQDSDEETAQSALARLGLCAADDASDGSASERSSLPESWCCVRFEEIAAITGGVTLGRKLTGRKTLTLPYLRVANVKRGKIDVGTMKEIDIAEDEVERYALAAGDLLLTEGGDWDKVGRAAMWDGRISPCLHQNHIFRARMRSSEISPFWVECCLNSPSGRAYFESAAKQTTNLASINMRQVRACPIPFPPLQEQERILRKLDQLMAMVDRLDSQLKASRETAGTLLDAVVHELLHPSAEMVEFPINSQSCAAIGCYTIQKLMQNRSFGHTMNMKVVYLAQAHIGLPLDLQFDRRPAGPWHPWIEEFDAMGQREGWFTVTQKPIGDGRTKYEYAPKAALKQKAAEAVAVLGEHKREFDRMLGIFADLNTEQAEIVATLFAAWNDFLIDGKTPTDNEIICEVRENWHPTKERFDAPLLTRWLGWMRRNRLVPQGIGPRTIQQFRLALR